MARFRQSELRDLLVILVMVSVFIIVKAVILCHAAWALRSSASHAATKSDTSQSRSVTPAAIAGVVRRVR
jgi:hypothetical protein